MKRIIAPRAPLAATLAVAALTLALVAAAKPAAAQDHYLTTGTYSTSDSTYAAGSTYVGANTSGGSTDSNGKPYVAMLTINPGATVNYANAYSSSSTVNVLGGNVTAVSANLYLATVNISGGNVSGADGVGTINISGGTVGSVDIRGGGDRNGNGSRVNFSGGTLTRNAFIEDTATVDFQGTNLSSKYNGYVKYSNRGSYADSFTVSGFFAGASQSYTVLVRNDDGVYNPNTFGYGPAAANSTPRQFSFNGVSAAVIPEAGTLALVVPALGMIGAVVVRRKKATAA